MMHQSIFRGGQICNLHFIEKKFISDASPMQVEFLNDDCKHQCTFKSRCNKGLFLYYSLSALLDPPPVEPNFLDSWHLFKEKSVNSVHSFWHLLKQAQILCRRCEVTGHQFSFYLILIGVGVNTPILDIHDILFIRTIGAQK